jgi:hypothetical protein
MLRRLRAALNSQTTQISLCLDGKLLLVVALACLGARGSDAGVHATEQNCGCIATRQTGTYSNTPKFILDEETNLLLGDEFAAAKSEWNGALAASGSSTRLGWNTPDGAVRVYFDDAVCATGWAETRTQYLTMRICRAAMSNWDFVRRLIRHELGHVLGLAMNPQCSKAASVMTDIQPSEIEGAAISIGCADWGAILEYFAPPQRRDNDGDGYSPDDPPQSSTWERGDDSCDSDAGRNPGISPMCSDTFDPEQDYNCDGQEDLYQCQSPILIDVAGNGFALTDAIGGVAFDIDGDGLAQHLSWTTAGGDDSWLVLDRNGNRTIDDGSEMFGNFTPQPASATPNGFIALRMFDENADRWIDAADSVFARLRLWTDGNHDGLSQSGELRSLSAAGVARLSVTFTESHRRDRYGNIFKYKAAIQDVSGGEIGPVAWDVFLISLPRSGRQASEVPGRNDR